MKKNGKSEKIPCESVEALKDVIHKARQKARKIMEQAEILDKLVGSKVR